LSDVNANISINFDTGQALASLRQLQAGLSRFNQSLTQGNVAATTAQKGLNDQLMQAINATGKFVATQKDIATSTSSFTSALEKNQLSMREYFRYTAAAATANTKVFKGMFAQEREIINRARKDRVKSLQAQYIQLSDASGNFVKTLQVVPKHLKMVDGKFADYATRMQMAAQKQQILNQLLKQGSTQLLNFGKNTQWAGRQLMVGLTIPLSILGSTAAKVFMEMEQAVVKFSRVYGDMNTSLGDTNEAVEKIKTLGKEFTKYGIAVKDTVEMAASAAAMGLTGADLLAQVTQATRLSVLGQVEQQQALETTISLQNAFGISAEQLAQKINFLNAVENQTVLSIEDLTIAVPKAGPVVKQLGGSVEDLAFFMTAMKEGGINASEGANALKSGLASMINPSAKASKFLSELGINIKGIVNANAGDLKGTVVGFARALDTLDPLNRARAIEQMFGKFQFARLSTLFQNVTKDGSQASRTFLLAGKSVEELAILSERELGKVENAVGVKFKKSIENLKNELVPVGKAFLQAATPIVEFVGKVLAKFNNLSDGTKKTIAIVVGVLGGLAPVLLMTFGILMNGVANGIKLFALLRNGIAKLNGQNNILGGGFDYLTQQQTEALAQTNALHTSHSQLISTFNVEKSSVDALALAYSNAASQARALAASSPGLFNAVPGAAGAVSGLPQKPLAFAQGGVVPGRGDKDTVPAMLTPGEVILTKDTVRNNPELVAALQNNSFKKYHDGTGGGSEDIAASLRARFAVSSAPGSEDFQGRMKTLIDGAMSQTDKGVERVIKFAAASGVEITAEQTDQVEFYRKKMLKAIESAGTALVDAIDLSADQIKKRLKEMSPIPGTQATKGFNTFDLIDKHGNQPQSETFGHLTPGTRMSGPQTRERLEPGSKVATEVDAIERAATYLNNLPKSDPRRPKTPIVPEFNVVSGLGIDGMSQETNTLLKNGTKNTQEFLNELGNVGPLQAWDTLMKQNGLTVEENGREIEILHAKFKAFVADLATKKKVISDADVTGFLTGIENDPDISPRMKNAVKRSENKITAARLSGVSSEDGANIEDVVRSGEVKVPGLVDRTKFKIAKSGSAQGGESASNRVNGIGFYDAEVEEQLAAEAETLRPPKVKATPEAEADAEAEGEKIGKAATRGVKKGAKTESPSTDGIEVGKDIAEGVVIGLQQGTPGVVSQSEQLGKAAIPKRQRTAAETQAQVDKMDLDNAAFYSDLDTPEFRDERQVLKSIDRNRRKRGAVRQVADAMPGTEAPSQTARLTVSLSKRVSTATDALAVKTEEAVTAQTQVVEQIKDESRSRVTIKGNTVNIGKAREDADRLDKEASDAEAAAAKIRTEAAKWEEVAAREKGKNMQTAENAKDLKKLADEAEIKAAEARIKAAEAERVAAELENGDGAIEQIIQDPVKTPSKVKKAEEVIANGTVEQGDGLRRIVEGTDDTVKSTTIVAENTDELADLTGDVLDPQSENLDSVITTANLNDSIANTTSDLQSSTLDSAVVQEELTDLQKEEQFLREKLNNNLVKQNLAAEQAISQTDGNIPSTYIDKDKALLEAYGDGTEENPGFTQNKKGQILLDPETGEPTTLTKRQITKKKRGMRREAVGKFSGKISGGLGTAAMVAGMAGAPPQVTAALGAAATIAQFAPMIAGLGPIGIALAAVTAVGAGLWLFNKRMTDISKAAAKFAASTVASAKKMLEISTITGKVGSVELMKKKAPNQFNEYSASRERRGQMFGDTFLQSDVGKTFQSDMLKQKEKLGAKETAKNVAQELAVYVSDGIMTAEQANSIADQIGINLKDRTFAIDIEGNLMQIIGPGGDDLVRNPLAVRLKIINNAKERSKMLARETKQNQDLSNPDSPIELIPELTRTQMREKAAAMHTYDSSTVAIAAAQAAATERDYEDRILLLEKELEVTESKEKQLELSKQIDALRQKEKLDLAIINSELSNAITTATKNYTALTGNTNAQDSIWDSIRAQMAIVFKDDADALAAAQAVEKRLQEVLDNPERAGWNDFQSSSFKPPRDPNAPPINPSIGLAMTPEEQAELDKLYKDNPSLAPENRNKVAAGEFALKMAMFLNEKLMTADQENLLMDLYAGDLVTANAVMDYSIREHGVSKTSALFNAFVGFEDTALAKTMIAKIAVQKNDQFDESMKAVDFLATMDGHEINMELFMAKPGEFDALVKSLAEIYALDDPITKTVMMDLDKTSTTDFAGLLANWDTYYSKLPDKVRKQAIATYDTIYRSTVIQTPEEKEKWATEWAAAQAFMVNQDTNSVEYKKVLLTKFTYAMGLTDGQQADIKTQTIIGSLDYINSLKGLNDGDDTPKERDTTYDDLLKRLRNVRNAAIDAAKGVSELNKALLASGSKSVQNKFQGISQQLRAKGVNEEFIEYLKGLDTKDLKKFAFIAKESGKIKYTEKVAKRDKEGKIVKDKKGKTQYVNKVQKYEKGELVLTDLGNQMKRGSEKALMGEFQEAQLKALRNYKDQETVQRKLRALKYDELTIERILSDEMATQLIASGRHTTEELKLTAALVKEKALREKINGLIESGVEAQKFAANIKRAPEVKKFFGDMESKGIKLSPAAMQGMLTDPAQLDGAIAAMDLYGTSADDALSALMRMADALNAIKANSNIKFAAEFAAKDNYGKVQAGMEAATKVMAARRVAYTNMTPAELKKVQVTNSRTGVTTDAGSIGYANAVKNKFGDPKAAAKLEASIAGKSLAGVQAERATLATRSKVAGAVANVSAGALSAAQNELSRMQEGLSDTLNSINKKYDDIIKGQQNAIDALNKTLNDKFEKQMKLKQERVSVLSNDLTLMDKQAESINEKYDAQVTALQEVQKVQQAITDQQQQQLDLADALTQGDISAAARAAQEMRAANADEYGSGQLEALDLSRKNELDSLKGPETGLTRKQITDEQFQIQQDIYKLETSPERKKILEDIEKLTEEIAKNDENRAKEIAKAESDMQAQVAAQEAIVKNLKLAADADAKITGELAQQDAELASQEAALEAIVDSVVEVDDFTGLTLKDWILLAEKVLDSEGLMQSIAQALLASEGSSAKMAESWASILASIDKMPKEFTTTQFIDVVTRTSNIVTTTTKKEDPPTESAEVTAARKAKDDAQLELDTATKNQKDAENRGEWYKFSSLLGIVTDKKLKLVEATAALDAALAAAAKKEPTAEEIAAAAKKKAEDAKLAAEKAALEGTDNPNWKPGDAMQFRAKGGMINPMRFAMGGFAKGSDTVPAMLTPGEFVMSKYAVQSHGIGNMKAINSGAPLAGDSVYNYSVNVAVQSDANPDEIARAVMRQIRQVDSQRITGNRN
jgi:hypothetical protein